HAEPGPDRLSRVILAGHEEESGVVPHLLGDLSGRPVPVDQEHALPVDELGGGVLLTGAVGALVEVAGFGPVREHGGGRYRIVTGHGAAVDTVHPVAIVLHRHDRVDQRRPQVDATGVHGTAADRGEPV